MSAFTLNTRSCMIYLASDTPLLHLLISLGLPAVLLSSLATQIH